MRVLILEDSPKRVKKFRQKLIGHEIVHTASAKEAIEYLKDSEIFDHCFLDHDLGDKVFVASGPGTGWEVAKWIGEHPEKRPSKIIVHSLNSNGARNMMNELGSPAEYIPFAWEYIQ